MDDESHERSHSFPLPSPGRILRSPLPAPGPGVLPLHGPGHRSGRRGRGSGLQRGEAPHAGAPSLPGAPGACLDRQCGGARRNVPLQRHLPVQQPSGLPGTEHLLRRADGVQRLLRPDGIHSDGRRTGGAVGGGLRSPRLPGGPGRSTPSWPGLHPGGKRLGRSRRGHPLLWFLEEPLRCRPGHRGAKHHPERPAVDRGGGPPAHLRLHLLLHPRRPCGLPPELPRQRRDGSVGQRHGQFWVAFGPA